MPSTMMAYVGPDTNVVGMGSGMLFDWAHNQIYNLKEGNGATDGIRQFTGYISGDETLDRTRVQIGSLPFIFSNGAAAFTGHGMIVFISAPANSSTIAEVRASDLTFGSSFGAASGSTAPSDGTRIIEPVSMAPMRSGGSDYVVTASLAALQPGEINIMTTPGLSNSKVGNTDEGQAVVGRGPGVVYALGKPGFPGATPLGLYVVTGGLGSLTKKGTVSPAQVDATWTNFSGASGVAYDQTDGNPIIAVQTTDAVANQRYFVKLNQTNAAVIWKCPVNGTDSSGDMDMGRHNIVNQRLYFLGAGGTLYTINTATGVATSAVIGTLTIGGPQISEDVNDSLIAFCGWNETTTHPTYIGTYMGTLGNHGPIGAGWLRFFPNGATLPLPPMPPPPPSSLGHKFLAESGPVRI